MKRVVIFLLFFLVACAEPSIRPSYNYHPKDKEEAWKITGRLVSNLFSHRLNINIDGQQVIEGALNVIGNGSLFGSYNGSNIEASCQGKRMSRYSLSRVECLVLVDSEESVTLNFY